MRLALALILVTSCAKSSREASAPVEQGGGAGSAAPVGGAQPPQEATAIQPPPVNAQQPTGGIAPDKTAVDPKEAARSQGLVGPTTDPELFRPLEDGAADKAKHRGGSPKGTGKPGASTGKLEVSSDKPTTTPRPGSPPPEAAFGAVTLDDGSDAAAVRTALAGRLAKVQACYVKLLASIPGRVGEMKLAFAVDASGKLGSVKVASSTMKDALLDRCVVDAVQSLVVAKGHAASGSLTVTFGK